MKRIILASASPRRKRLLEQININFQVAPQDIVETVDLSMKPEEFAETTALRKAQHSAGKFSNSLIIGSDTIVVHHNQILGKPSNEEQATAMLTRLSDDSHTVITGVALLKTGSKGEIVDKTVFNEQTIVTFSLLNSKEIQDYINTGSPMDKAGAYGIQDDWGSVFVSGIKGDYYNVVGFPLHRFYHTLKSFVPGLLPEPAPKF